MMCSLVTKLQPVVFGSLPAVGEETLDALLAKGFKFVTVSELIAMDKPAVPKPKAPPVPKTDVPAAPKAEPVAAGTPAPAAKAKP